MTREEAIAMLKSKMDGSVDTSYEWAEALRMAIEALSAEAEQVTSKLKKSCDSLLKFDSDECKEQKSKLDLISRADAIEAVCGDCTIENRESCKRDGYCYEVRNLMALPSADAVKYESTVTLNSPISIPAEAVQRWIPFTRRPMTEEEQKDYPNCTFMFDCVLPDDGDEILVSNGRFVWMDTFCNDIDGCYLDSNGDIDEDMAWMPLPKPYKGGDSE